MTQCGISCYPATDDRHSFNADDSIRHQRADTTPLAPRTPRIVRIVWDGLGRFGPQRDDDKRSISNDTYWTLSLKVLLATDWE